MARSVSAEHFAGFIRRFTDPLWEPYFTDYLPHLRNLNRLVTAVGEPLEGNVFYNTTSSGDALSALYRPKRRNLALLSIASTRVLEIGFNAGYSTLLMLTANPKLHFVSVDICAHQYTRPCVEYMQTVFGTRLEFHAGDSRAVLPRLLSRDNAFDAYLIDGGHRVDVAEADLSNILRHARDGNTLCFDDTDMPALRILLNIYMLQGAISPLTERFFLPGEGQGFFRINK